jgi:hypothetical protein
MIKDIHHRQGKELCIHINGHWQFWNYEKAQTPCPKPIQEMSEGFCP